MARAVLDPGVLVSALITPTGRPAELLLSARAGGFDLVVSPLLLDELGLALQQKKFRRYVDLDGVAALVSGDSDLLELADRIPVLSPPEFSPG